MFDSLSPQVDWAVEGQCRYFCGLELNSPIRGRYTGRDFAEIEGLESLELFGADGADDSGAGAGSLRSVLGRAVVCPPAPAGASFSPNLWETLAPQLGGMGEEGGRRYCVDALACLVELACSSVRRGTAGAAAAAATAGSAVAAPSSPPVRWGWVPSLHGFLFVFTAANRLVRPTCSSGVCCFPFETWCLASLNHHRGHAIFRCWSFRTTGSPRICLRWRSP